MEEEKLLSSLKISKFKLLFLLMYGIAFTNLVLASDNILVPSLLEDARNIVIENSKETLLQFSKENPSYRFPFEVEEVLMANEQPNAQLYVFVSTSMPKEVIRRYYKDATKYNGVLVFKGLPNGGFKELQLLILELKESNSTQQGDNASSDQAGVIIDDESFKKFGITSVPAIALVKEEECFEQATCKTSYDLITGNIGIKYALEAFAKAGDLGKEASHLLDIKRGLQ